MYPVPSRCAFAFAGELSARHSRCWRFRGLLVHHCYDLLGCSPPLQETFTSGLSTARSPSPLPDITTVATGQFPPAGLTPAGPTASVAAQLPPPHAVASDLRCRGQTIRCNTQRDKAIASIARSARWQAPSRVGIFHAGKHLPKRNITPFSDRGRSPTAPTRSPRRLEREAWVAAKSPAPSPS